MAKGQEVEAQTAEVAELPPAVASMIMELRQAASAPAENPAQISLDIVERILTADTIEEATAGTTDIVEIINQPLTVSLRSWNPSKLGEFGVFAVLECKDGTGKEHIISCGGRNVVAIVYRLWKEDRFPVRAQFRDAETAQGYTTLWLDVLPE